MILSLISHLSINFSSFLLNMLMDGPSAWLKRAYIKPRSYLYLQDCECIIFTCICHWEELNMLMLLITTLLILMHMFSYEILAILLDICEQFTGPSILTWLKWRETHFMSCEESNPVLILCKKWENDDNAFDI